VSIWATWLALDDDHAEECSIWVAESDGAFAATGVCDCGQPDYPFEYRGSHHLPSEADPRGGSVQVAAVPDHITRDGRDDGKEGDRKPWIRLSLNDEDVVLNEAQVRKLWQCLGDWLAADEVA
jgi:hypothetical protein